MEKFKITESAQLCSSQQTKFLCRHNNGIAIEIGL